MPLTKDQQRRLRIIDACINSKYKPYPSKEELQAICSEKLFGIGELGVSMSTIEKDLKYLKDEFDAPIYFDKKQKGYTYTESFSLESIELHPEEKEALRMAVRWLGQFKQSSEGEHIGGAIAKLEESLVLFDQSSRDHIFYEKLPQQLGLEWFEVLNQAIENKRTLSISYYSLKSDSIKNYLVSPYALKQYMQHWYLLLRDHQNNRILVFELGRIEAINESEENWLSPEFEVADYFKYSAGVTVTQGRVYQVELRLEPAVVEFVKRFAIHPNQGDIKQGLLKFKSFISPELLRNIAGYGHQVEVLKPDELRQALENYMA